MVPDLPWETLLESFPAIFDLAALSFLAFGFFCLYRLDKIPKLWIPGSVIILLLIRVIDTTTFLWASGGDYAAAEVNLAYQIAAVYLSHFWALMLVQVGVTVVIGVAFWLLWIGQIPRCFWLATISTLSAMSLVGAATNVLSVFGFYLL